nr:hypothetical protein [Tanacetum cinerariifolium]
LFWFCPHHTHSSTRPFSPRHLRLLYLERGLLPVKTEIHESPHTVAPPTCHVVESEGSGTSGARTIRLAVRVSPAMSPSFSISIAEEEDKEVEESSDSDSESEDAEEEGHITEDDDPAAGDEGLAAGDEGPDMGVESLGLGWNEAVPEG